MSELKGKLKTALLGDTVKKILRNAMHELPELIDVTLIQWEPIYGPGACRVNTQVVCAMCNEEHINLDLVTTEIIIDWESNV